MTMRGLVTLIVALAIVGVLAELGGAAARAAAVFAALDVQQPPVPAPAPELALPDLNGRTVRLSEFRGRVVLLSFFTTT